MMRIWTMVWCILMVVEGAGTGWLANQYGKIIHCASTLIERKQAVVVSYGSNESNGIGIDSGTEQQLPGNNSHMVAEDFDTRRVQAMPGAEDARRLLDVQGAGDARRFLEMPGAGPSAELRKAQSSTKFGTPELRQAQSSKKLSASESYKACTALTSYQSAKECLGTALQSSSCAEVCYKECTALQSLYELPILKTQVLYVRHKCCMHVIGSAHSATLTPFGG